MAYLDTRSRRSKVDRQFIFSTIASAGSLTLVDNNDIWKETQRFPLFAESKLSELYGSTEAVPKRFSSSALPDILDESGAITPTGFEILNDLGITVGIENLSLSATADISLWGGENFTYTSILMTDKSTFIAIHPEIRNASSRTDWNLLAWYLIFRTYGADITISSDDRALNSSAFSFTKLGY